MKVLPREDGMSGDGKDFWKWSLLVFLSARSVDLAQAAVGLWIIPTCVAKNDIGAVLPVVEGANILALPLAIVVVPFAKWLAIYSRRDDWGRVKTLLRLMLGWSALSVCVIGLFSCPFARTLSDAVRVTRPELGGLLLVTGALTALAPVFDGALQGLSQFRTFATAGFVSALARFVISSALIPACGLIGCLCGVAGAALARCAVVLVGLRPMLGRAVRPRKIPPETGRLMLRYAFPVALSLTVWKLVDMYQAVVVRINLSDVESAAYYVVTRFGELGQWIGLSVMFVAFPFIAAVDGDRTRRQAVLVRTIGMTLMGGSVVALASWPAAPFLLRTVSVWRDYAGFAAYVPLIVFRYALGCSVGAFMSCEQAAGDFRYLYYLVPCIVIECVGLSWITTLGGMLWWLFATVAFQALVVIVVVVSRRVPGGKANEASAGRGGG